MVMNYQADSVNNQEKIKSLLKQLRKKVKSFEVINLRGQSLGFIEDFVLDKYRRLYMAIPKLNAQADSAAYLVSSKHIQKVDTSNKIIFVDIGLEKYYQLPQYYLSKENTTEPSKSSETPLAKLDNLTRSSEVRALDENQPSKTRHFTTKNREEGNQPSLAESNDVLEVAEEQTIPLLEERLLVTRGKRKVGEVVVRKQIETRVVEVPIQSEKLIIEKVSSKSEQPVEVQSWPVDQASHNEVALSGNLPTTLATRLNNSTFGETPAIGETQPSMSHASGTQKLQEVDNHSFLESDDTVEVVEEELVRLLEERLVVSRSKWKVGEVVLRKEVENQIVQVPIRREKLIIEQVSPEIKQIAEIDLGKGEVTGVTFGEAPSSDILHREVLSSDTPSPATVRGEFLSPKAASHLLEAIALQGRHGCAKVRVELVLDNPELQETYQTMFDRCSKL